MKLENLIIVGGCGSSGTTLLVNLLARHPSIAAGPELSCFNHPEIADFERVRREHATWFRRGLPSRGYHQVYRFIGKRDHYRITLDDVRAWVERSRDPRGFFHEIGSALAARHGRPIFAEKTPTNVYAFAEIAAAVDDVPLVHVVRDGRDVVCSLRRRGYGLFRAASRWLYDTLAGLRARGSANYREIRYEELTSRPVETLEGLLRPWGLDFDASAFEEHVRSSSEAHDSWAGSRVLGRWTQTPSEPVSARSVGRYREELSRSELDLIDRVVLDDAARSLLGAKVRSFRELIELLEYPTAACESFSRQPSIGEKLLAWRDQARRIGNSLRHFAPPPSVLTRVGVLDSSTARNEVRA
jgi:protein-tyrosine sulfotransferase